MNILVVVAVLLWREILFPTTEHEELEACVDEGEAGSYMHDDVCLFVVLCGGRD